MNDVEQLKFEELNKTKTQQDLEEKIENEGTCKYRLDSFNYGVTHSSDYCNYNGKCKYQKIALIYSPVDIVFCELRYKFDK